MKASENIPSQKEVIRKEINFLRYPYFALSTKGLKNRQRTEVHRIIQRGDEELEIVWKVNAHPDYGYPGPLAKKLNTYIEHLVSQRPYPITNPIRLGSSYQICKALKVTADQWHYKAIRKCIVQVITTTIETKHTYYRKRKKQWMEEVFHLYDHFVQKGECLDDGTMADTNYLYLNSWYIENLNAKFIKLIDHAYLEALDLPVSRRLYEILDLSFFTVTRNPDIPCIRYSYSQICDLLPLERQKHLSRARQQFGPAHEELTRTGFFAKVEWTPIPGTRDDWYLKYWPGRGYYEEASRFNTGHKVLPAHADGCNLDIPNVSEEDELEMPGYHGKSLEHQQALPFRNEADFQEPSEGKEQSPEIPIDLGEEPTAPSISTQERYCISLLKTIPGYPFTHSKDLELIWDLIADFPKLDLGNEIKDWKTWLMDNSLKGKVNYRSRLRRWMKNSNKYMEEENEAGCAPNKYADAVWEDPDGDRASC
jgi:Replication initiator protein A